MLKAINEDVYSVFDGGAYLVSLSSIVPMKHKRVAKCLIAATALIIVAMTPVLSGLALAQPAPTQTLKVWNRIPTLPYHNT